jgi:hypothetical protein
MSERAKVWCHDHPWTLSYIAVVVTLMLILQVAMWFTGKA